ncbi:MAG TPA: YdeI family protein [Anaerolineaceae bacterium]|nr:YdeI family protein [Anaerolineaceae bacterium]
MNQINPKVDAFLSREKKWPQEFKKLREIILDCNLTEELKWGVPCYTFEKNNIVLIHGFKDYCAILFPKGVLLNDPEKILIIQTKNVQSARQIRFTNLQQIERLEFTIKAYVNEAIEVEKAGLKVDFKKTAEFNMPEEFQNILDEMPDLKTAFEALTPGRQRGYLLFFSSPKQSKTKVARIEKTIQRIFEGKGLND